MDQRLKERLIGAVVLVALAVWLIPWLLDGPERESVAETVALELPAAEESAPVKTVTVDLDDRDRPGAQAGTAAGHDERAGAATDSGPALGAASGAAGDTAVASDEVPAADADAERVPVAEADAETAGARAASGGEAGGAADAEAGASGGAGAGIAGAETGAGEPRREAAEAAADEAGGEARDAAGDAAEAAVGSAGGEGAEAEGAADEAGAEPAAAASVPAGTAPAGDWAVQLGSFGEIVNAERLAARVESFGYEPEVSTYTAGGRELHRVRVGPQPSRARAEAVVSSLTAHGFVAQVVTAD